MLTTGELVATGIIMGIIHVLTGPDHLSALATLSGTDVCTRNTNYFLLGVKWGIGHSCGLIVVAGILIALEEQSPKKSEWIGTDDDGGWSQVFEWFVGIFMLGLGIYGLKKACRHSRPPDFIEMGSCNSASNSTLSRGGKKQSRDDVSVQSSIIGHMEDILREDEEQESELIQPKDVSDQRNRDGHMPGLDEDEEVDPEVLEAAASLLKDPFDCSDQEDEEIPEQFLTALKSSRSESFLVYQAKNKQSLAKLSRAKSLVKKHAHPENSAANEMKLSSRKCYRCCSTSGVLALIAGIIHGVAGPGGVLGVIPAVQLREPKLAAIYLSMFCVTSTFVMGCFASFYGSLSEYLALGGGGGGEAGGGAQSMRSVRVFFVEVGSALLSIGVGIVWLVLLGVGKMEEIFP